MEISFNGVGDADNSKLISVSTEPGAATGVGIGIYDNTNTLVDLNTGKSATVLKEGQTVLYFTANYVATKNAVTIGYGNAEVDFNLILQLIDPDGTIISQWQQIICCHYSPQ